MPRLIRIGERTPLILQTTTGEVKVCRCGLSKTPPYCDGSEALLEGEDAELTYTYDDKGKRSVLDHNDAKKPASLSNAWKWMLPVAYILIPVNIINTMTGYAKLPSKVLLKGQVPGVSQNFLEKTPYGYLFPVVVQIAAVLIITWLAQHPQVLKPQHWVEQVDAHVDVHKKDKFFLFVRRLLTAVALLVSVFCTYISGVLLFSAFIGETKVPVGLMLGFGALFLVIIATWIILVRRHFAKQMAVGQPPVVPVA